jgi:hypothetical protein
MEIIARRFFLTGEAPNHAKPTRVDHARHRTQRSERLNKAFESSQGRFWYLFLLFSILVVLGHLIMTTSDRFFFTGLTFVIARLAAVGLARLGSARWDY